MRHVLFVMLVLTLLAMTQTASADPVNFVPEDRYTVTVDDAQVSVPMLYDSERDLSPYEPHPEITRLVLFPSNGTREVLPIGQTLQDAATLTGVFETTMFIGLQFLYQEDIEFWELEDDVCYWQHQYWYFGHLSKSSPQHPRDVFASSMTFMDSMLVELVTNNPQLEAITVVGESAGGKLVHRWAAATRLFEEMELPPMIFVTVNNGNWLYFDPHRFDLDDEWTLPGPITQTYVPRWDKYPYGVDELNEFTILTGEDYIVENYPNRNFFYFVGQDDTGLNSDDKPMNMQGMNNIIRHVVYWDYLTFFYGEENLGRHQLWVMEEYGHDGHAIIRTQECRQAMFLYLPPPDDNVDEGSPAELPSHVELETYPNPFNPSATVKVALPTPGHLEVKVFNMMGQFVATLADEEVAAGNHTFTFDGSELSSGVYFVQVAGPDQIFETKKLTLMK
jgi:Secretion system C-terminal sorting domain